jgi:hypothetical protein
MTTAENEALALLADCSSGATGPALAARGVTQVTLDRLVARGLVTARLRTFANPPGLTVTHYQQVDYYCECCGRALDPMRIKWLELNCRTGKWTDPDVAPLPAETSQGCFPFGIACAKARLKG